MSEQWLGPFLAALGGGLTAWLAGQQLRRRAAVGRHRLQRMRLLGFDEPEGPRLRRDHGRSRRPVLAAAAAAAAAGLGLAAVSGLGRQWITLGVAVAVAVAWISGLAVRRRRLREEVLLEEQLEQGLVTATQSLKAGLSLAQALEVAWGEAEQPFHADLGAVLAEYRVGRPLEQSLQDWSRRRRSEDLAFFARALGIHRDSGGDLSLVLSNLAETVRERRLLRLDLQAKTSEARLTAAVLIAMVPLLGFYLAALHPTMLSPLWRHPLGRLGLGYATFSWLAGAVLVQNLVRLPTGGGG